MELITGLFQSDGLLLGTIVPFLFVLIIVVFIHEMGHYLVGRLCGIGVEAFSIGFGPEIFGFNDSHGTRWKLSAIPLGGYVKFLGDMSVTSSHSDEDTMQQLDDEQLRHAFHTQPVWKRALTVAAGPMANFILTIAVFAVMFSVYGKSLSDPVATDVQAGSPAFEAGFKPGDIFISVDGSKVETFNDVIRQVSGRAGDTLTFVVERDGQNITLQATPKLIEDKDALGNVFKRGVIGVSSNSKAANRRLIELSPWEATQEAVAQTGHALSGVFRFIGRFATGREDKCQLGGPIKVADMASKAAKSGISPLFQLIALLSVGIGFLNLLPIPPLDGGHLLFYAIEAVKGSPVSERVLNIFYQVGFILVLMFMGFVFWNDLFGC